MDCIMYSLYMLRAKQMKNLHISCSFTILLPKINGSEGLSLTLDGGGSKNWTKFALYTREC